jgi:hypothetical protein
MVVLVEGHQCTETDANVAKVNVSKSTVNALMPIRNAGGIVGVWGVRIIVWEVVFRLG